MRIERCRYCSRYSCVCPEPEATAVEMAAAGVLLVGIAMVLQAAWNYALLCLALVVVYLIWAYWNCRSVSEDLSDVREVVQETVERYRPRQTSRRPPPDDRDLPPPETYRPPPSERYRPSRDTLRRALDDPDLGGADAEYWDV